ncbi:MAG: WG repeat-containing protein [Cyclobacteriaceae bacterium]|nr:MAG: WG repeat-containing protein [Cyclobacteriaceae bacterium]
MKTVLLVCLLTTSLSGWADSFQTFEENGKVGLKNQEGKVVLPASFEALGWSDGSFSVIGNVTGYRQNNQWGILNLKKEFITKAEYESLVYSGGDYVVVKKKINPAQRKTACLNLRGEIQIPFVYDDIQVHGLRAIVINLINGRYQYGLVDLQNKLIIPASYSRISPLGTLRYAVQNSSGKIALYAEDGRAITTFTIDSISMFQGDKAFFYVNANMGLLDREGNLLVEALYQSIKIEDDRISVLPHHQWIVLDAANKTVQNFQAENILKASPGNNIYQLSGQFGLMDETWTVTLPAQYQNLTYVQDDLFLAQKDFKTGIITSTNKPVIPLQYDSVVVNYPHVRALSRFGWALTDISRTFTSFKTYSQIDAPQYGLFPVKSNQFWGALTLQGEETIHCVFDSLLEISDNHVVVKFKGQYGIISPREEWVVAPQLHPVRLVNDSSYLQLEPANQFLKSFDGNIIYFTDNKIDFGSDFFTEYLPDGTIKKLDYRGRLISRKEPPQVDKVEAVFEEQEGLRGIKRDGKYGFIDALGRLRIANRYDGIGDFSEGLAAIKLIGRWGFINAQDQIIINPNYNEAAQFSKGLCVVTRNGKTGVINRQGKFILNLEYDSIAREADKFRLYKNGLTGLADGSGRILIEPRFNQLTVLSNGAVNVTHTQKSGVISAEGLSIIPIMYDALHYYREKNQYLALQKAKWETLNPTR